MPRQVGMLRVGVQRFSRRFQNFERVHPSPVLPVEAVRTSVRRRNQMRPGLRRIRICLPESFDARAVQRENERGRGFVSCRGLCRVERVVLNAAVDFADEGAFAGLVQLTHPQAERHHESHEPCCRSDGCRNDQMQTDFLVTRLFRRVRAYSEGDFACRERQQRRNLGARGAEAVAAHLDCQPANYFRRRICRNDCADRIEALTVHEIGQRRIGGVERNRCGRSFECGAKASASDDEQQRVTPFFQGDRRVHIAVLIGVAGTRHAIDIDQAMSLRCQEHDFVAIGVDVCIRVAAPERVVGEPAVFVGSDLTPIRRRFDSRSGISVREYDAFSSDRRMPVASDQLRLERIAMQGVASATGNRSEDQAVRHCDRTGRADKTGFVPRSRRLRWERGTFYQQHHTCCEQRGSRLRRQFVTQDSREKPF